MLCPYGCSSPSNNLLVRFYEQNCVTIPKIVDKVKLNGILKSHSSQLTVCGLQLFIFRRSKPHKQYVVLLLWHLQARTMVILHCISVMELPSHQGLPKT